MPAASMKQLLEAGVHFGHQTRRWNPKMKPYIFADRGGIHIIDLQKTTVLLDSAYDFVRNIATRGGSVLFVGTKKQCQDVIRDEAQRVGMPFVSHRWLGGLLTNFSTIEMRIGRMHELRKLKEEGQLSLLPTKERMGLERELEKLEINLGGVSDMRRLPDAVFVADPKREAIATKEVNKLGIPLIGLVDTNCDPDEVDFVIPGNDDAIRSCGLIIKTLAKAVEEGRQKVQIAEFYQAEAARQEAEAQGGTGRGEAPGQQAPEARPSRAPRSGGSEGGRGDNRPGGRGQQGGRGRDAGGRDGGYRGGPGGPGRDMGGPRGAAPARAPRRPAPPRPVETAGAPVAPSAPEAVHDAAADVAAAARETAPEVVQTAPLTEAAAQEAAPAAPHAAPSVPEAPAAPEQSEVPASDAAPSADAGEA
jgi:small subunit ribosomal protein S2